jgi:hypothetical protein
MTTQTKQTDKTDQTDHTDQTDQTQTTQRRGRLFRRPRAASQAQNVRPRRRPSSNWLRSLDHQPFIFY